MTCTAVIIIATLLRFQGILVVHQEKIFGVCNQATVMLCIISDDATCTCNLYKILSLIAYVCNLMKHLQKRKSL